MVQNKQIRIFLFLLSGIVLLFCGSIPNFAESVIALLRGLLSFINLGWIGTLLIISRVLLILGGTALSVIGAIFMIQDATAAKRQPNWVVLGCTGGGIFFGLLSLVPLLFWIGIFGVAALVVAMVFAYKDVVGAWRNPVSKIASFMMIGSLVAFFDRFYNIPMGLMETHWLAGLCGIAAFIYLCVWKGKLAIHLDEAGRGGMQLFFVGAILYAVATLFNFFPFVNFLGWILAVAAWVVVLIGYIKLMNSTSFGKSGNKPGMFMMIGHLVAILSFIPLFNLAALASVGFGWWMMISGLEEKA